MVKRGLCGDWRIFGRFLLAVFILEHVLIALRISQLTRSQSHDNTHATSNSERTVTSPVPVCTANCSVDLNNPLVVYYSHMPPDPLAKPGTYYFRRPTKVNVFNYNYLQKPDSPCDNNTFMAVLVHSKSSYSEMRNVIRQTWGSALATSQWPVANTEPLPKIKLVFMLGADSQPAWNSYVQLENRLHNDIVQGSFMDSYINMTLKSLLGLRWVWQECPQARYMLKMDDDMVVNFPHLINLLNTKGYSRFILGPLNPGSNVERRGLWGVPESVYPFAKWPMYASGAAYVISQDIVKELYDAAEYIPHIHVDDAYITGILAKVINAGHKSEAGFAYWGSPKPGPCAFIKNRIYTGTKVQSREDKLLFWNQLSNATYIKRC